LLADILLQLAQIEAGEEAIAALLHRAFS
jgi:hypothetical protein